MNLGKKYHQKQKKKRILNQKYLLDKYLTFHSN